MCPNPKKEPTETESPDTDCAPSATFHLSPDDLANVQSASVKCTKCNKSTPHEWVAVRPIMLTEEEVDVMELLKLAKRMMLCTHCGTLRLTN